MSAEWIESKLGSVIELKRGYDLPRQDRAIGRIPIVSSSGISDYNSKSMAKAPGVVTGRYGTIGQVFYITQDFWPLNTTLYVRDFKGNHPRFIAYMLGTINFQAYSDKAAVPGVNRNDLHEAIITLPPLPEQRAIAHILGTLDDKIELNRKMNETLEAMARALFKSWFVDFDPVRKKMAGEPTGLPAEIDALFPGEFEDSALGEVPKGWQVGKIKDFASNIQYGLTQSASIEPVGPKFLRITDIQGGQVNWTTVPFCKVGAEDEAKYKLKIGDIVVARTGASTGENMFVRFTPNAVFASYLVRFQFPRIETARFVAVHMRRPEYFEFIAQSMGGSAQPNASAQVLADHALVWPTDEIEAAFFRHLSPWDNKISANEMTNASLIALRDTLLPKLISGELRVRDAERFVGGGSESRMKKITRMPRMLYCEICRVTVLSVKSLNLCNP